MMRRILIVGGANGIGLSIAKVLTAKDDVEQVYIVDKAPLAEGYQEEKIKSFLFDLNSSDFSIFDQFDDIDGLVITAGFGQLELFEDIPEILIPSYFNVNTIAAIRIIKHFYHRLLSNHDFYCGVMVSIAGFITSPFLSVYGATKAALRIFIESVNVELEKAGSSNRILNVSPGYIKGTNFYGDSNHFEDTKGLACDIVCRMNARETLFIPQYEEIYQRVLERYHQDAHRFGLESYEYKKNGDRIRRKPQIKIGYLSGTFDLFHIGHLNLLRRAKQCCDYLVVGVHKDASHKGKDTFIPFEERVSIIKSIKYVDEVILAEREDCDVYDKGIVRYDYLFVGSDYKGSERFNRYEVYFADKEVKIVYFPYTKGTSSTQLREVLSKKKEL